VALVVLIFSAVTFVAVYSGTGAQLRRQIDHEIAGEAGDLAHALSAVKQRSHHQIFEVARAFIRGRPFSSSLLFVIVPGAGVATNRPELFSVEAAPDEGESVAEQDQENRMPTTATPR
jgi:hypothetical protein